VFLCFSNNFCNYHLHKSNQYAAKEFGTCPLIQCSGQPVLPVSLKDEVGAGTVKIYCPKCGQVYHPPAGRPRTGPNAGVDGAAFGTTFAHLFLMTFSNLVPDPLPVDSTYIPRVFGFRVHQSAARKSEQRYSPIAAVSAAAAETKKKDSSGKSGSSVAGNEGKKGRKRANNNNKANNNGGAFLMDSPKKRRRNNTSNPPPNNNNA